MPRESTPYEAAIEVREAITSTNEELHDIVLAIGKINALLDTLCELQRKPMGYEYCYADNLKDMLVLGAQLWHFKADLSYVAEGGLRTPLYLMERGVWEDGTIG